jgi:O-antigen ligase
MQVTVGERTMSSCFLQGSPEVVYRDAFPWFSAILFSFVILLSENYFPADALANELSTDVQASILQGSVVRQIGYLIIALIGMAWFVRMKGYRLVAWRSPLLLAFGSLLLWSALSISWSQEPEISTKRLLGYLFMITAAAGASAMWSRGEILKFISLSGAAHLTVGVVGEMIIGNFTPWTSGYRFAGTLPYNVQGFCCLVLGLSSLAASDADPRYKMMFRCIALYGLTFLVLTRSRSSMLGGVVGLLVYCMLTRSLRVKFISVMTLSISALVLYMFGAMDSLIAFLSRNGEGSGDFTGRVPVWQLAQTFVSRRPMTGYGYHDFWTVANVDYFSSEFHWTISAAHSGYIETLLTLGYFGLLLHTLVLVLGFVIGVRLFMMSRSPSFALAATICVVVLVVSTLEVVVLWSTSPYSFGIMLLVLSLCINKRRPENHRPRLILSACRSHSEQMIGGMS